MAGRVLAGMAEMAGMAGMAGKSGCNFFWHLLLLRLCISFSDSRVDSRFRQVLHDSHERRTRAGQLAVGWQGVVSGGLGSGQVGSGRQFSYFRTLAIGFAHISSLSLLGVGQLPVLEGSSLAFRFPASGNHGLVTVKIRFQLCHSQFGTLLLYHRYITDFDAIALNSTFGVLRPCPARNAPSGMCRYLGGWSTLQRD